MYQRRPIKGGAMDNKRSSARPRWPEIAKDHITVPITNAYKHDEVLGTMTLKKPAADMIAAGVARLLPAVIKAEGKPDELVEMGLCMSVESRNGSKISSGVVAERVECKQPSSKDEGFVSSLKR